MSSIVEEPWAMLPPRVTRHGDGWRLVCAQVLRRPLHETFEFFERPENLERITPDVLRFEILTPRPITMRAGLILDYRLRLCGVPVAWRTRITRYEPGRLFVDEQIRGPFARWIHRHEFHPHAEGTWMRDELEFRSRFSILGRVAERVFVARLVRRIFEHRARVIAALVERRPVE